MAGAGQYCAQKIRAEVTVPPGARRRQRFGLDPVGVILLSSGPHIVLAQREARASKQPSGTGQLVQIPA